MKKDLANKITKDINYLRKNISDVMSLPGVSLSEDYKTYALMSDHLTLMSHVSEHLAQGMLIPKLFETLSRWKNTRADLPKALQCENLRCAVDLVKILNLLGCQVPKELYEEGEQ